MTGFSAAAEADGFAEFERQFARNSGKLERFRASYDSDEALRLRIDAGDSGPALEALGMRLPDGMDVRVVPASEDVHYVVMPPDPGFRLKDFQLETVVGGTPGFGTASSVLTAGTFMCTCLPSSFGTLGSAGTASSNE